MAMALALVWAKAEVMAAVTRLAFAMAAVLSLVVLEWVAAARCCELVMVARLKLDGRAWEQLM